MEIKYNIFFITSILGVVCLLKMLFLRRNTVLINKYFVLLIATLTIRQIIFLIGFNLDNKGPIVDVVTTFFNLIHYLELYLVSISVLHKAENKSRFFYHVLVLLLFYLTLNTLLLFNYKDNYLIKYLIDLIYCGGISIINFIMIKRYFINEKSNANFKSFTVNWYLLIIVLFSLTPLKFLVQIFSAVADGTIIVNLAYQLVNSVICAIIFVAILIQQNNLKDDENVDNNWNYSTNEDNGLDTIWKMKIDQLELNQADKKVEKRIAIKMDYYIAKINTVNYETSILLKRNATIDDFALELKIPKSHLNFIFKYKSKINFVAFKNRVRIEKAKKLIENGYLDTNTLNSLAENIGFRSYDPFFKSFKENTTMGPMEYGIRTKKISN